MRGGERVCVRLGRAAHMARGSGCELAPGTVCTACSFVAGARTAPDAGTSGICVKAAGNLCLEFRVHVATGAAMRAPQPRGWGGLAQAGLQTTFCTCRYIGCSCGIAPR